MRRTFFYLAFQMPFSSKTISLSLILILTLISNTLSARPPSLSPKKEAKLQAKPLLRVLYLGDFPNEISEKGFFPAEDWLQRSISRHWQKLRQKNTKKTTSASALPLSQEQKKHALAPIVYVQKVPTSQSTFLNRIAHLTTRDDLNQWDLIVLDPSAQKNPLPKKQNHFFIDESGRVRTSPPAHSNLRSFSLQNLHPQHRAPPPLSSSAQKRMLKYMLQLSELEWKHSFDVVWLKRPQQDFSFYEKNIPALRLLSLSAAQKTTTFFNLEQDPIKETSEEAPIDSPSALENALSHHIISRLTQLPINDHFDLLTIDVSAFQSRELELDKKPQKAAAHRAKNRASLSMRTARWPLKDAALAEGYAAAATALGNWKLHLWDRFITQKDLQRIAECKTGKNFVQNAREVLQRPVDVRDFLLLLDDILSAGRGFLRGRRLHLPPSRLRSSGAFLHPHDIFRKKFKRKSYRVYPAQQHTLWIAPGKPPADVSRAKNGDKLGPPWYRRYANPASERTRMKALTAKNPDFAVRLSSLITQLRQQKARVSVDSTVRKQQRGYLMYGAFWLSQAQSESEVQKRSQILRKLNRKWHLNVRIQWKHPAGWQATVEAAREMKDTYGVVYATRRGAEKSDHYDGNATDLSAPHLPRRLRLKAPDGAMRTFRFGAEAARDLSLSPQLIEWIETHFSIQKLKGDYPHWSDQKKSKK